MWRTGASSQTFPQLEGSVVRTSSYWTETDRCATKYMFPSNSMLCTRVHTTTFVRETPALVRAVSVPFRDLHGRGGSGFMRYGSILVGVTSLFVCCGRLWVSFRYLYLRVVRYSEKCCVELSIKCNALF